MLSKNEWTVGRVVPDYYRSTMGLPVITVDIPVGFDSTLKMATDSNEHELQWTDGM
jgi:hypothetical protein